MRSGLETSEVPAAWRRRLVPCLFGGILAAAVSDRAQAQCQSWSTQFSQAGINQAFALLPYNDGAGAKIYAGSFGVARWTGSAWIVLFGLDGYYDLIVNALCEFDDGTGPALYAGGGFDTPCNGIAKWSGGAWHAVSSGLYVSLAPGLVYVNAMLVFDDGTGPALFMGGHFGGAPGFVASDGIIKWNGSTWTGLASGITGSDPGEQRFVDALVSFDDGTGPALYAGGAFTSIGGVTANRIAKWDGVTWSPLDSGMDWRVSALAVYDDGAGPALYAGGWFSSAGGVPAAGLAKWDGVAWSDVPGPSIGVVWALRVFDDGSGPALFVGGSGSAALPGAIAKWNGLSWSQLGSGVNADVYAMTEFDDGSGSGPALFVGGSFGQVGDGIHSQGVAKWITCRDSIAAVCTGDGSFAPCPCSNHGSAGHGCQNSTGLGGARLSWTGTTSPDTLTLYSDFEPPSARSLIVMGDAQSSTPIMFGDGIRCAGGNLLRMYLHPAVNGTVQAPQAGEPSISQRAANLGFPILPGDVRYLQVWYRDPVLAVCPPPNGNAFNISNALRVIW